MFRHINKGNFSRTYEFDEQGRSLVEMLGTLAIMGILSMAGIWAYNTAMDKVRANTLINEAQKRAVIVAGQIGFQGSTNPSLGEFSENEFAGSTFSQSVVTHGLYKQFGIQISNVSKSVCQNILNSIGDGTPLRRLTGVGTPRVPITSCTEDNTMLMIYNNDMSDKTGDTSYTCEKDSDCSACGTCNAETHACENECVVPEIAGGCDFDNECNANNKCMICNENTRQCEDGCHRVEYLESSGTQWIDTGINLKSIVMASYEIEFSEVSSWNEVYGVYFDKTTVPRMQQFIMNGEWRGESGVFSGFQIGATVALNTKYSITVQNRSVQNSNATLYFFARNNDKDTYGPAKHMKAYSLKMTSNDILLRDFIPVHAPFQPNGKQNCMFDRVSGDLFCNANNGDDFIIP